MAKIANTFVTTDAVGNREELADVVDRVLRDETPLYSMIRKEGAASTYPEWETDAIEEPGVLQLIHALDAELVDRRRRNGVVGLDHWELLGARDGVLHLVEAHTAQGDRPAGR